jgi:uncharacterized damage-inducible protein DinB
MRFQQSFAQTARRPAMLEAIRTLYDYNIWANTRILDSAERLKLQQFIAGNGGESIRALLVHTAWSEWLWLQRCQGHSPRERWNPGDFPYVATLRQRWEEVDAATQAYLAGLTEPDLARTITYANFQGETWSYPRWQALLHQVNHATQHRSEAAQLMTRFGCSPGDLDLLIYVDEKAAAG